MVNLTKNFIFKFYRFTPTPKIANLWPSKPSPRSKQIFHNLFFRSYWGNVKNSIFFHNVKCLLQINLSEEKFGFDTFKPQQLDFAGIYQPFFLPNSPWIPSFKYLKVILIKLGLNQPFCLTDCQIREGFNKKKSHKLGLFAQPEGGRGPEGVIGPNPLNRYPFFVWYCSKCTETFFSIMTSPFELLISKEWTL